MEPNKNIILVTQEPRGPSQLVEIPVPAQVVSRVALPDVQQLRSQVGQIIVIKALRLISNKVLTNAPVSGFATATLAELKKISLVLYCEGWEKGQLIPLLTLNDVVDADSTATGIPYRVVTTRLSDWRNVDWSKSFLQYSNGTPSSGAAYAVLLEVEYIKLDSAGKEIVGPS